jgi:DMSO/TMAO reductase YedYZ molybdopterin-dependent catalytic subunit
LITTGLGASAGIIAGAGAVRLAGRHGLIPPDSRGLYGPGHTLTYAAQRLLTHNSFAREFSTAQISKHPFPNTLPPTAKEYSVLQAAGFADWQLAIDGMVERPGSITLTQLKRYPLKSQITQLICEEGWSFIAEWTGVSLSYVLNLAGVLPQARYVVYFSLDPNWLDSIDMADALHPQTLLTYGMNGADLPPGHGGPLRLRVPRQLGYKSVKYITRMTVTDSLKGFKPVGDYSWYAGI